MSDTPANSDINPFDILNAEPLPEIKPRTTTTGLNRQQYFGKVPQMLSVIESKIDTDLQHLYSGGKSRQRWLGGSPGLLDLVL